jgi:ribosome biogenesis protein SSF1/2
MKQRKNNKGFRRPVIIKNKGKQPEPQPSVDPITGKKIPKSFVFCRGKLPVPLKQLQMDLRKLMLPYTALSLKVNNVHFFFIMFG